MDNDVESKQAGYAAAKINQEGEQRYATLRGYRESFSGQERNHLFLNDPNGKGEPRFVDISGISGVDSPADARSTVLWDYDRDGWLDLAVINTNTPLLELWRNKLGDAPGATGQVLAVRFVGSNHEPKPNKGRSNRDGFGARVMLKLADKEILREHHCGEGLSAQNTNTILVGIGAQKIVERLGVSWPAGGSAELKDVAAGSLVTIYEDKHQSPTGEHFVVERYLRAKPTPKPSQSALTASNSLKLGKTRNPALNSKLVVYTTIGAECKSCITELPYLDSIQQAMPPEDVAFFGLPMDPKDEFADLAAWGALHKPPYWLVADINAAERAHAERLVKDSSAPLGLGNTIITDAEGRVLKIRYGPTSVSELRRLLAR